MKICKDCNIEKPLDQFPKKYDKWGDPYRKMCLICYAVQRNNKYKKKNFTVSVSQKQCEGCSVTKPSEEFYKNNKIITGLNRLCIECISFENKQRYENNNVQFKKNSINYYYKNKDKIRKTRKIYTKKKMKEDPFFKVKRNLRNRLYYALKNTVWKKNSKFTSYIGCDRDTLINHIESQFIDMMSWDNYGDWHIDHKIPLASAITEQELYTLCHYTNLQPLWAEDNIKKGYKTS